MRRFRRIPILFCLFMTAADLAVVQWLVSPAAQPWITWAATNKASLAIQTRTLRQTLSAAQTHAILEQIELRRRARVKFSRADEMFFSRQALEQATSERVGWWKAQRIAACLEGFEPVRRVVGDLCCGIGGDLLAIAQYFSVQGFDRDDTIATLARANLTALGLASSSVHCVDVRLAPIHKFAAWHLDPDRRPDQHRVAQPDLAEPGVDTIDAFLRDNPNGAIKLAPAAEVSSDWQLQGEREWISDDGECKQQVAWFGAMCRQPNRHTATALSPRCEPCSFTGDAELPWPFETSLGRFLYEPDAAVLAAGLCGDLAARLNLHAFEPQVAYFTSDRRSENPLLAGFEVQEVMPFDRKRVKAMLKHRRVGRLEVKKRGLPLNAPLLQRELRVPGDETGTLLIAPRGGQTVAILARRLPREYTDAKSVEPPQGEA